MPTYLDIDSVRGEDRLDSRDLIELRDLMASELEDVEDGGEQYDGQRDELRDGIAAIDELESEYGSSEWAYGAFFIRRDCFEDYARELAEDIGAITGYEAWPANCIDWERAASELATDYGSVEFLGHDYYVR